MSSGISPRRYTIAMELSDFDFELPKNLIAQTPARPRNHARLLVYNRKTRAITDDYFYNLGQYLLPGSTIVLNNSKVEKSRLLFPGCEVFVLQTINPTTIKALVRPGRKFKLQQTLQLDLDGVGLAIKTLRIEADGVRWLQLSLPINHRALKKYRHTPFPPYIHARPELSRQYQTVYAQPLGSKAAPTAGLHFTAGQLQQLSKTHPLVRITLHVGLGTFAPIKTGNITQHKLHPETYAVSAQAASELNQAKSITAIGTTSVRVLEAAGPVFAAQDSQTDIFIRPGYDFKATNSLVTNFHLPKSSLLMLVAAFMGSTSEMQRVYRHAINKKYRFYSFGDAMLIL